MFTENPKPYNTLWWIISIAISVLCCSILFVLFASYLDEVKASVRDQEMHLRLIESRQYRILSEIETLREHENPIASAVTTPPATPDAQTTVPAPDTQPSVAPATTAAPAPPETMAPIVTVPTLPTAPTTPPATTPAPAPISSTAPISSAAPEIPADKK